MAASLCDLIDKKVGYSFNLINISDCQVRFSVFSTCKKLFQNDTGMSKSLSLNKYNFLLVRASQLDKVIEV